MASLSASGLAPMSAAIAGREVAITVESMFSMNSATATISGTIRSRMTVSGGAGAGIFVKRLFNPSFGRYIGFVVNNQKGGDPVSHYHRPVSVSVSWILALVEVSAS